MKFKDFIREEVKRQLAEAKKQSEPTPTDREYWLEKLEKGMKSFKGSISDDKGNRVSVKITGDKLVAASVIDLLAREQRRFHKETGKGFSIEVEYQAE